jgi:ABC-type molybdate transport system ATPase subunit
MTDLNKAIISEMTSLSENQKKDVLDYVKTLKNDDSKKKIPFIGLCENEPEIVDLLMANVIEMRKGKNG